MFRCFIFVFSFLHITATSNAAYCHGKPDPKAKPNHIPIDKVPPRLVKTVANGKLYTAGSAQDTFDIVHVWGLPYDMGYAHGILQKHKTKQMIDQVWKYLEQQVAQAMNKTLHFKDWFLKDVANLGLAAALDLELAATATYTIQSFFDEARGLADASGADFMKILHIHLIGELTKGSCSMLGAWGSSVSKPGSLLQLRSLDWAVDGPFKDFPQVTVYHPANESYGLDWANFGWTGWIGSITGMNSEKLAISEIGVTYPDDTFGDESRFGIPFTNILRDVLNYDHTLDDATSRLANAKRTCDLILGVGDGKLGRFTGVAYSGSKIEFFDDENMLPFAPEWHPRIPDVVYWGMDWLCPSYSKVLANNVKKHYGNLTADVIIHGIVPVIQSGNLQVAVYDLAENMAYLANARASYDTGPMDAYNRQFVQLNMTSLFAEEKPNSQH